MFTASLWLHVGSKRAGLGGDKDRSRETPGEAAATVQPEAVDGATGAVGSDLF